MAFHEHLPVNQALSIGHGISRAAQCPPIQRGHCRLLVFGLLQSHFFGDRLVATFGFRGDRVKLDALGYRNDPILGDVVDPDPANPSPLTDGDLDAAKWGIDSRFLQNRPREEVERVAGAVSAAMPLASLQKHLESVDVGPHGVVMVRDSALRLRSLQNERHSVANACAFRVHVTPISTQADALGASE